jgi:hypothetical protein
MPENGVGRAGEPRLAHTPLRLMNTVIRTIRYLLALGMPAAGAVPDPGIVYCP